MAFSLFEWSQAIISYRCNLKVNQSRSRFGKIYNLVFLIVKIQKNGGKFEFILLKTLGCKFFQNGTSNNLALVKNLIFF